MDAELGEGHADLGPLVNDPDVGAEREAESRADGVSVDRCDRRHLEIADREEEAIEVGSPADARPGVGIVRGLFRQALEAATGAEGVTRSTDHDDASIRLVDLSDGALDLLPHLGDHCVALFGRVQGQPRNRAIVLQQDHLVRHAAEV